MPPATRTITERRRAFRYPGNAQLGFQVLHDTATISGVGTLINLSDTGILFRPSSDLYLDLQAGQNIETFIPWPLRSAGGLAIELYVSGKIIRSQGTGTAVAISRYEFRVQERKFPANQGSLHYTGAGRSA